MNFFKRFCLVAGLAVSSLVFSGCDTLSVNLPGAKSRAKVAPVEGRMLVYFGTYTKRASEGIYVFELDLKSGALTQVGTNGLAAESVNPSFLAIHPDGKRLFAVNEIGDYKGEKSGAVSAFMIDRESGKLTLINQQSSKGGGPCHLVVDGSGKNVLVANYGGGSVACLPIDGQGGLKAASSFVQHEGSSVNPGRQKGPHGHSINVDPNNRFAAVGDLGLDKVLLYRLDSESGELTANEPAFTKVAPGAGPRHFAFHKSGKFAFVINELHCTVTAFNYDAQKGALSERQTISTLDVPLQKGFSTAEVQVHPSGKFLYGSNRGHDSVAVFAIDPSSGRLTRVQVQSTGGTTPRNFGIDPTGNYLLAANQNSDNVVVFRIDPVTGKLTATGVEVEVPTPVCVKFLQR
jgi:6-phosphogluconolactonase